MAADANDPKVILIDADAAFARTFYSGLNMGGDNLHPTPHGQAFAGSYATQKVMAALELLALPVFSTVLPDDLVTLESGGVPKQVKASALKAYLAA